MKRAILLSTLICIAMSLSGQDGERFGATAFDIDPTPVPAVLTTVIGTTVYLREVTLTNITASDVTCLIQDRQTTPRAVYNNVVKPGLYIMQFNGRKMPNGISWNCADSTSVIGYVQGTK